MPPIDRLRIGSLAKWLKRSLVKQVFPGSPPWKPIDTLTAHRAHESLSAHGWRPSRPGVLEFGDLAAEILLFSIHIAARPIKRCAFNRKLKSALATRSCTDRTHRGQDHAYHAVGMVKQTPQ